MTLKRLFSIAILFPVLAFSQSSPVIRVNSTSELVALSIPSVNSKFSAIVGGSTNGVGAVFIYDSASSATTNSFSVFKPAASSGRWLRIDGRATSTGGRVYTGVVGASGVSRSDSTLELQSDFPFLTLFNNELPPTTVALGNEEAVGFFAYDSSNTPEKNASISSGFVDTDHSTGYSILRLNATKAPGFTDDVALRIFGGHGVSVFGASDTSATAPGDKKFQVVGTILGGAGVITSNLTQGSVIDLNYGISGKFTGNALTGTLLEGHAFLNTNSTKGVILGHDSASQTGLVISYGANSALGFVTHNGSWGTRILITTAGIVTIPGTTDATTGGAGAITTAGGLYTSKGIVAGTFISPSASGVTWQAGVGSPEGVITASIGSLWSRTDGGASTSFYVKESGSGNTGWVAK